MWLWKDSQKLRECMVSTTSHLLEMEIALFNPHSSKGFLVMVIVSGSWSVLTTHANAIGEHWRSWCMITLHIKAEVV